MVTSCWRTPSVRRRKSTVTQASSGGQDDQRPVPLGHGGDQGFDPLGGQRLDPPGLGAGQPDIHARGSGHQPVAYRRPEYAGYEAVDDADGGRGQILLQAADPRLDLGRPDGAEGPVAEGWVDVAAQVRLDLRRGRGPVDLGHPPSLGNVAEQNPAGPGVDETANGDLDPDRGQEPASVGRLGEVLCLLLASLITPPGLPAAAPPVGGRGHLTVLAAARLSRIGMRLVPAVVHA
jgi:hypothetical protein